MDRSSSLRVDAMAGNWVLGVVVDSGAVGSCDVWLPGMTRDDLTSASRVEKRRIEGWRAFKGAMCTYLSGELS